MDAIEEGSETEHAQGPSCVGEHHAQSTVRAESMSVEKLTTSSTGLEYPVGSVASRPNNLASIDGDEWEEWILVVEEEVFHGQEEEGEEHIVA